MIASRVKQNSLTLRQQGTHSRKASFTAPINISIQQKENCVLKDQKTNGYEVNFSTLNEGKQNSAQKNQLQQNKIADHQLEKQNDQGQIVRLLTSQLQSLYQMIQDISQKQEDKFVKLEARVHKIEQLACEKVEYNTQKNILEQGKSETISEIQDNCAFKSDELRGFQEQKNNKKKLNNKRTQSLQDFRLQSFLKSACRQNALTSNFSSNSIQQKDEDINSTAQNISFENYKNTHVFTKILLSKHAQDVKTLPNEVQDLQSNLSFKKTTVSRINNAHKKIQCIAKIRQGDDNKKVPLSSDRSQTAIDQEKDSQEDSVTLAEATIWQKQQYQENAASEKAKIKNVMRKHKEKLGDKVCGSQGKADEAKYLVPAAWWRDWIKYVNFDAPEEETDHKSRANTQTAPNFSNYQRPSCIQNAELLLLEPKTNQKSKEDSFKKLRPNLLEHFDFECLPRRVFRHLRKWYGVDYEIVRFLRRDPCVPEKLFLDLYPAIGNSFAATCTELRIPRPPICKINLSKEQRNLTHQEQENDKDKCTIQ